LRPRPVSIGWLVGSVNFWGVGSVFRCSIVVVIQSPPPNCTGKDCWRRFFFFFSEDPVEGWTIRDGTGGLTNDRAARCWKLFAAGGLAGLYVTSARGCYPETVRACACASLCVSLLQPCLATMFGERRLARNVRSAQLCDSQTTTITTTTTTTTTTTQRGGGSSIVLGWLLLLLLLLLLLNDKQIVVPRTADRPAKQARSGGHWQKKKSPLWWADPGIRLSLDGI